jgi:hypothetical protein
MTEAGDWNVAPAVATGAPHPATASRASTKIEALITPIGRSIACTGSVACGLFHERPAHEAIVRSEAVASGEPGAGGVLDANWPTADAARRCVNAPDLRQVRDDRLGPTP